VAVEWYEKSETGRDYPGKYAGEFLRCTMGSSLYGPSVPGHNDLDLMGVMIEPALASIGIKRPFEQHEFRTAGGQNPSQPGDVDLVVYSLRKFMTLAAGGNPTILNLLFVPAAYRVIDSPLADRIRQLSPSIVSRDAARRYRGYIGHQRERMLGQRGQKRTGAHRAKFLTNPKDGSKPFDGKYGMHMIRLGLQGIELMETGKITLPMAEPHRSEVFGIRVGEKSQDEVVAWAEELEASLLALSKDSLLPPSADTDLLNRWVTETYLRYWPDGIQPTWSFDSTPLHGVR